MFNHRELLFNGENKPVVAVVQQGGGSAWERCSAHPSGTGDAFGLEGSTSGGGRCSHPRTILFLHHVICAK